MLAGVLAFAALAGVLVAQASGRRDPGDTVSGSIDQSVTEKLNEAGRCFSEGDADCAIELYDEVLADQPTNAEAMTYKGWAQYVLLGDTEEALDLLIEAATTHRDYPAVHAFLGGSVLAAGSCSRRATSSTASMRSIRLLSPRADRRAP